MLQNADHDRFDYPDSRSDYGCSKGEWHCHVGMDRPNA